VVRQRCLFSEVALAAEETETIDRREVRQDGTAGAILSAVTELLEAEGYDGVELREVARRAHVSLATIYKLFPTRPNLLRTRDALIIEAIERWQAANAYGHLATPPADATLHNALIDVFRHVFEPWESCPRMLEAYHRARSGPGGERLPLQGATAVVPVLREILEDADPDYVADISAILTNLTYGLIGRFVDGEVRITEVLPTLERAVARLTSNNEPAAQAALRRRQRRRAH
jgi:TetR/AcrR family transcriptional regulator, cholesterol catabolism regulator